MTQNVPMKSHSLQVMLMVTALVGATIILWAQEAHQIQGYSDTPLLPDSKWHVHDPARPQPPSVAPAPLDLAAKPVAPPAGATVLFDGTNLSKWRADNGAPSGWTVKDGTMEVPPGGTPGGGDIATKELFGDMQLHIEWCAPEKVEGQGQNRGNSGVFLMERYELQVLDSFDNPTYPDGQAGAVYGQTPPMVNASRAPGQWQSYDVFWTAPRFQAGQLKSPAFITVLHNGVLVQNHTQLLGATFHRQVGKYTPHEPTAPIRLQDHGARVRYRNIWVRPLTLAQ